MQMSFFDGTKDFYFQKPIRLIEFFAGYGSQALALNELEVEFQHWRICEWAIKSIQAYKDNHFPNDNTDYSRDLKGFEIRDILFNMGISSNYNEPLTIEQLNRYGEPMWRKIYNNIKATHNLVNISSVKGKDLDIRDTDKYDYVLTYSFPCQDLSKAGKGKGMARDSGTRSGLLWEVERILDELYADGGVDKLPKILLMENVPDVLGIAVENLKNLRIRKLTPKECFRLMAVRDENFDRIAKNQSNASLYHLAGDSIVVSVLVAILGQFVKGFDFNEYVESFYNQIKEQ